MSATTPTDTELFEGYDRARQRSEEQIGSGMLLRIPEVPKSWYEVKNGRNGGESFVTPSVFQNERYAESSPILFSAFNAASRRAIAAALRSKCDPCQAGTPARRMIA